MIHLANNMKLDTSRAVCETFAFVARRGAGKTYAAGVLVEGMLDEHAQVVVLDPVGVWYGLRLRAGGKSSSKLDIPVFGGEHGDIPLLPESGKIIADVIVERGISAVLDVSSFSKKKRQQFVADFAERLFARKKTARSPIHVVLEEAQIFAPQRVGPDQARMLGAIEDVVRLGRNYGLGATLISQRPQSVNKEVLNQVEVLCALQITGPHERKAIKEWAANNADYRYKDIDTILPGLQVGEAIVWSPQWLRCFEQVKFNKKRTYDASATPDFDEVSVEPQPLDAAELQQLLDDMQGMVDKAAADDPVKLRARIRELEKQLNDKPDVAPYAASELANIEHRVEVTKQLLMDVTQEVNSIGNDLMSLTSNVKAGVSPIQRAVKKETKKTYKVSKPVNLNGTPKLRAGGMRMLHALTCRPELTKAQLATLGGMSIKSGTFSTYLSELKRYGFIYGDDPYEITEEGNAYLANAGLDSKPFAGSPEAMRDLWLPKFRAGARRMLEALIERPMTKSELAEQIDMAMSGTFTTYLSELKRNGLVHYNSNDGVLRADDLLVS